MELYKVELPHFKKRFYESKRTFDQNWARNLKRSRYGDVVAYKIDWKEQNWKCIRRVGPNINYYSD